MTTKKSARITPVPTNMLQHVYVPRAEKEKALFLLVKICLLAYHIGP